MPLLHRAILGTLLLAIAGNTTPLRSQTAAPPSDLPLPAKTDVPKPSGAPGGLKVFDWAGFRGAVTYTFDDNLPSQVAAYPRLHATGIRMTFFLNSDGYATNSTKSAWAQIAKDGNELGNHTAHHCKADGTGCQGWAGSIDAEYNQCDAFIKKYSDVTQVWSTASPYGDTGYDDAAKKHFFLNRGVGPGLIQPYDNSDPYNLPINGSGAGLTAASFNAQIDSARNSGSWLIFLFHSLGNNDGYAPVNAPDVLESIDHAQSSGDLWIDTMVNVGAYWEGQKAVASAVSKKSDSTTELHWTLPAHFPPGKYVRVTLKGGTPSQNGKNIPWNSAGFYEISLDAGLLTITP